MKALLTVVFAVWAMFQTQALLAQCPTQRAIVPPEVVVVSDGYTGSGILAQLDITVNGKVYRIPCLCVSDRSSLVIQVVSTDVVDDEEKHAELRSTSKGYFWSSANAVNLAEVEYNPY